MKKLTIFFAFIAFAINTFAQASLPSSLTNNEIAQTILMSKEANQQNGIFDPNVIHEGQTLTFLFADGTEHQIIVEDNDNQWKILKTKLAALVAAHGAVENNNSVAVTPEPEPESKAETVLPNPVPAADTNWWKWAALALVVIVIAMIAVSMIRNQAATGDPVTAGPAIREGGVTDEQSLAYANEVASRQFNRPNLNVMNVTRGRISGTNVAVFYAGQATPQRRTFSNVMGYRGTVIVDGNEQFVYFLQGCGNDVRIGNYFAGENIQFIPEAVIHQQSVDVPPVTQQESTATQNQQLTALVTALVKPLNNQKNGKLKVTIPGGAVIEMSFSETLVISNSNHIGENNSVAANVTAHQQS